MTDINKLVEQLAEIRDLWEGVLDPIEWETPISNAITALQEMQKDYIRVFQRALDAEQKNREFNEQFSKHQSTWWDREDKLQKRIAELELACDFHSTRASDELKNES